MSQFVAFEIDFCDENHPCSKGLFKNVQKA